MKRPYVLLFGDQTVESYPVIKQIARHSKSSLSLRIFFRDTTDALRFNIEKLQTSQRERFHSFNSILGLAEAHVQSGASDVVLSTVLLCIAQLGSLIIHAEHDAHILDSTPDVEAHILGLCTGLLSAAAAATARSTGELLKIAPEIICISLRLALEADHRSAQLEHSRKSWAVAIPSMSATNLQNQIDDFHQKNVLVSFFPSTILQAYNEQIIPLCKHAYISAESDSSTTVSGPPSVLARLFSSDTLSTASKINLPITAAFHARHLDRPASEKIVGSSPLLEMHIKKNVRVMSTGLGTQCSAGTVGALILQIVDDVLQIPLYWSKTLQSMVVGLSNGEVTLITFGPSNITNSVRRVIETSGIKVVESDKASSPAAESPPNGWEDIAIIGMSCRLPGSGNLEDFWKVLEAGQDLHTKIPKDRFDVDSHCDLSGAIKNTVLTPYGCFIDRPGSFDARLFNMSPREASQTDPTQRLILLTAYEALEMAGYSPNSSSTTRGDRMGTFFGQTTDDWRECNAAQNIDMYYVSGGLRPFGPGRLNYHFKWEGPSYSLDTACSSSSVSIQMACTSLLTRECDTAVAGGGNMMTGSNMYAGLSRGSFLSTTGSCKTFDDDADGYCRGEGVGSIVLKRLSVAIRDNDNIQGVIKSVATNHSANAVSITHPHAGAQERLYRRVLQDACVDPDEIEYVEMHGTGTQAGDMAEIESTTNVFGQSRKRDNPLYIGSVKPNVGHGEAVAGVTSLIKVLLMLQKNVIPPHAGIKGRLNHKFPSLEKMNVHIARSPVPFKAHRSNENGRRKILLNNFNATGGNTSMLLEEAPQPCVLGEDPRAAHVVAISGRTLTSLAWNKQRLLKYLTTNSQTRVADLSYSTTARKMHHVFRTAYTAGSTMELVGMIAKDLGESSEPTRTSNTGSVVFVFTGQGSHYSGMGKHLFETCKSFRDSILGFDSICVRQGQESFLKIITDPDMDIASMKPIQIHLGLVSLELALAILWQSWGLKPDVVIGHSLGEYPALCVAGVLSVVDMFFLVIKRAELLQNKCIANSHAMLAIQSPASSVEQVLRTTAAASCGIACVNSPRSTVISGTAEDINSVKARLDVDGVKVTLLEVPYAFHSPQMDPILAEFESAAQNVRFAPPIIPVASTLMGALVKTEGVFTANYLANQTRGKVDFLGALQACKAGEIFDDQTLWIENGPSPVCLGLVRATFQTPPARSLASLRPNEDCWKTISKAVANAFNGGVDLLWSNYHQEYENALRLLSLPTYAFDLKDYWIQYEGNWNLKSTNQALSNSASPSFSTTCLQRVESETFNKETASVTFVSNAAEPNLYAAIQGHLVNGVGLCPSSVYADMAFTAASYVYSKMKPSDPLPSMDVNDMEVFHPLVVLPNNPLQLIKISAVWSDGSIKVFFSSQNGGDTQEHAHCTVQYGDGSQWKAEWARFAYLVKARIDGLIQSAKEGLTHRILRDMVYKLFSALVVYDEKYQGLKEVFMDRTLHEAAASVKFQLNASSGDFTYSPYWIDTIAHLAGFVLNGSVMTPGDKVYISHGFKSMRIVGALSDEKAYSSYVRMQPIDGRGVFAGDVYIFDGEEIIAVCTGLKFQEIKKSLLHALLPGSPQMSTPTKDSSRNGTVDKYVSLISTNKAGGTTKVAASARMKRDPVAPISTPQWTKVLNKIAVEARLDVSEFVDEASFVELGIDSLLTISIMSTLQTQMALTLPASAFNMYPTVGELRTFFRNEYGSEEDLDSDKSCSESSNDVFTPSPADGNSATSVSSNEDPDVADVFISAVAAETGIDPVEMEPSTLFTDLGVESLMSIAVLSAVKEQTGRMLPASFLNDHPTVADARKALQNPSEPPQFSSTAKVGRSRPSKYSSRSVFLQGRLTSGLPTLFLIADGAGSAASYISLPPFPSGLPVYALESPFLAAPNDWTYSFEAVASMYVDEIRNVQPRGPYILGGWSLGGIHAYEVGRQLIAQGEEVRGLVFVDSPCPKTLPHMPEPTVELLETTGMFVGFKRAGKPDAPMPFTTKEHLVSCVKALKVYDPIPMQPGHQPRHIFQIWAKHGTFEKMGESVTEAKAAADRFKANPSASEPDTGLRKDWLTAPRKSFGPNGWDKLVGDHIECVAIEGDHFSIMNVPKIKLTGELMGTAIQKFLE